MKKNNKGMTVAEVLIAMAVMTVVMGIIYGLYFSNTKTISKNELKAMIQTDAQYVQNTLTNIGMQSSGIADIVASEIIDDTDFSGYYEVKSIDLKFKENQLDYIYRFSVEDSLDSSDDNKSLILYKIDKNGEEENIVQTSTLSQNVYSFKIESVYSSGTGDEILLKSKTVDVYFELGKRKGFSEVNYEISTLITFRNK